MASWKDRFTWKSRICIEKTIDDRQFKFYSNRIALLEELAEVSKPVGLAIAALLDKDETRNVTTEQFADKVRKDPKTGVETSENSIQRTIIGARTPETSAHIRQEREDAINSILGAIASKPNRVLLGRLLMDSLRDEFPYKKDGYSAAEVEEFLYGDDAGYEGLSLPMLVQLCQGWLAANAKVFGDLGEKVTAMVKEKLAELQTPPQAPSAVDGASSTMPSSEPSDSASVLISSSPST